MAKALKPLIVVVLLLSVVALSLGVMLFRQREQLKGRTQKLETKVVEVAAKLAAPREPHIEKLEHKIDRQALMSFTQMDKPLTQMLALADVRYSALFDTRETLVKTKDELSTTKGTLATTQKDLEDTKATIAPLRTELDTTKGDLSKAKEEITKFEEVKTGLKEQITKATERAAKAEDEIRDAKDKLAEQEKAYRQLMVEAGLTKPKIKPGLTGKVVLVNPAWNFCVLDIGGDAGLVPTVELLVNRQDQLVGKVRVSQVRRNLAVAEIVKDWEKSPLREGDNVLF